MVLATRVGRALLRGRLRLLRRLRRALDLRQDLMRRLRRLDLRQDLGDLGARHFPREWHLHAVKDLGFGRIVASNIEVPNMLANLV